MAPPLIQAPAGFVPEFAVSFGPRSGESRPVDVASGAIGPFTPDPGRPIWVTLAGTWSGTVSVLRSTDGGATRRPLTLAGGAWGIFTANAQEAVGEETVAGATWWLDFQRTSGILAYEVAQ